MARDLIVLAADQNVKFAVDGLLHRRESLGIRPIEFDIHVHPQRDPGCLRRSEGMLQLLCNDYDHALVVFDRHGCGKQEEAHEHLEAEVNARLQAKGWAGRSEVVVLNPELEAWVWSDSPHVERILGWRGRTPTLGEWLVQEGFKQPGFAKPNDPKRALEEALFLSRKPRSSALYRQLADSVSFKRCSDPSFEKFRQTMCTWFGL